MWYVRCDIWSRVLHFIIILISCIFSAHFSSTRIRDCDCLRTSMYMYSYANTTSIWSSGSCAWTFRGKSREICSKFYWRFGAMQLPMAVPQNTSLFCWLFSSSFRLVSNPIIYGTKVSPPITFLPCEFVNYYYYYYVCLSVRTKNSLRAMCTASWIIKS